MHYSTLPMTSAMMTPTSQVMGNCRRSGYGAEKTICSVRWRTWRAPRPDHCVNGYTHASGRTTRCARSSGTNEEAPGNTIAPNHHNQPTPLKASRISALSICR